MPRDDRLPSALLGALVPAGLAFANGGYFPTEWGLATLLLALAAATAVLLRDRIALGPLDLAPAAALAGLAVWQLLSLLWAPGPTEPVLEAERTLLYVALALAAPLVVSRASWPWLCGGVVGGVTAVAAWALATRLRPGALTDFDPSQLAEPIGYWNALGILVVLGLLLALGLSASRARLAPAAAAAVPLLGATLALTFSRGSWLALATGLCVLAALERERLRAAAVLAPVVALAAVAVGLALSLDGLAHRDATQAEARHDGGLMAVALLVLVVLAAASVAAAGRIEARWRPSGRVRRVWAAVLASAVVAVVVAGAVRIGSPGDVYDSFTAPLPAAGEDLGGRLTSASGNGRADYWRVAGDEIEAHPLLGGGAGSYERWWVLKRPSPFAAKDAHNLYLETLAELGPIGLALLLAALAPPLLVLRRGRAAAGAGAAYAAFLVHAALDWDWEVPAVTATGLLAGAAVLAAARTAPEREPTMRTRALALALLLPLAAVAAVANAGNRAAAAVDDAIARDDPDAASAAAHRARRWAPWSTDAQRLKAEAHLAEGETGPARAILLGALDRDPDDWELWYDLALASQGPERAGAAARARALNPLAPELTGLPPSRGTPQDP
jgi:hypothetical protein